MRGLVVGTAFELARLVLGHLDLMRSLIFYCRLSPGGRTQDFWMVLAKKKLRTRPWGLTNEMPNIWCVSRCHAVVFLLERQPFLVVVIDEPKYWSFELSAWYFFRSTNFFRFRAFQDQWKMIEKVVINRRWKAPVSTNSSSFFLTTISCCFALRPAQIVTVLWLSGGAGIQTLGSWVKSAETAPQRES